MKKEIIKRIIVWVTTVVLLLAGGVTVATVIQNLPEEPEITVEYSLNTEKFDGLITYGEEIDLSLITITKTENGVSTDIPVDISMVTTHVDTTRVGNATLELEYEGKEFFVPVTVKYRIQFKVDGEIVSTVHALTSSELKEVTPPQKEGYTFSGWSSDIPDVLYENLVLTPVYEADIPSLRAIDATYGDKLADITLPSSLAGAWRFDNAEGTVGNAGKRTFDVSFIENGTNAVLKTGKLTINVAKREVKIDVFADFTYNGTRQYPTYKTDVDVDVVSYSDQNNIDAGEYSYHFEVDDPNYTGEAKGTYVIKKAVVAVKINSYSIKANEAFPKAEYEVSGLEGMSKEEIVELIGLSIIYPDAVVVGEHKITAKASNPSIQLEVEEGTITVEQATFDGIGDPTPVVKVATYGDLLGSIEFSSHPNGKWVWETPEVKVGDVGKHTFAAIFIPSSSAFEEVRAEVEITVIPKPMKVEVVGNTIFDYDGKEHDIDFVVTDLDGTVREDLVVLGNASYKNAGSYTITLSFEDPNYAVFVDENNSSATKVVTLTIKKVNPDVDFEQILSIVWTPTLKLSDVAFPEEGYAWDNPSRRLETAVTASYAVTYTPADTTNYNIVTGEITVEVRKADASITGVTGGTNINTPLEKTYKEDGYSINDLFTLGKTPSDNTAKLSFTVNGVPKEAGEVAFTDVVPDGGVYTLVIKLSGDDNYEDDEITVYVKISPAPNTDSVTSSFSKPYGTLVKDAITLPTNENGTWSILNVDDTTTVGDVGVREFTLYFTPDSPNYADRTVTVKVNVGKKSVTAPTLTTAEAHKIYTGEKIYSGLEEGEGYIIIDPENPRNVDTYTVTLQLVNTTNYQWSDYSSADKTVTYWIDPATNEWTKEPQISGWEYGAKDVVGGTATPMVGTLKVEYKLASASDSTYSETLPTQAGSYVARFTATDANYKKLEETIPFTISKKKISVEYTERYTYTGSNIKAVIPESDLYSVSDNGRTGAGQEPCKATLTLTDEAFKNHEWADAPGSKTLQLSYYIDKAPVGLSDLKISGYKFGGTPAPSVSMALNISPTYTYYKDADCTEEITIGKTTPVGTYYVKASYPGSDNLLPDETDAVSFQITQADASINGITGGAEIVKEYRSTGYSFTDLFPKLSASHTETTLVYTVDGTVVDATTFSFAHVKANEEAYTVVITLPESHNHEKAEVTVTVKITSVGNNDVFNPVYNVTYGDPISTLEAQLPESEFGAWTIVETTLGDAGNGKPFTAVFTPYEQYKGDYATRTYSITVNVLRADVTIADKDGNILPILPTESTSKRDYNGLEFVLPEEVKTSNGVALNPVIMKWNERTEAYDIPVGENETVKEIKGVGTYVVTYTYSGDNNHNGASAKITVTIDKVNDLAFNNEISIQGWTYGEYNATINAYTPVSANKDFANQLIKYQYQYSADGTTWSEDNWIDWTDSTDPATFGAGSYKIRAIIIGTENYKQVVSVKSFNIGQATASINNIAHGAEISNPYRGTAYTLADLFASVTANQGTTQYAYTDLTYTYKNEQTTFEGVTNFSTNTIVITLPGNRNYKTASVEVTVKVTQATINITIGTAEWTYGQYNNAVNRPQVTITGDFINPDPATIPYTLQYSTDGVKWEDWNEEKVAALGANTYKTRVVVADIEGTNYKGKTVYSTDANVKVNRAPLNSFTVIGDQSGTYTSNAFTIPSVKAVNGVTLGHANVGAEVIIKKNGETVGEIRGAGTYTITYNFAATQNYQAGSTTVEFTVAPGQINFVGTPTIAPWSYQGYNATVNKPSITVKLGDVNVATLTGVTIPVVFHYYSDEACTPESKITDSTVEGYQAILNALDVTTYYVKAEVVDDGKTVGGVYNGNYYGNWSDATSFTLTPANVTIQDANNTAFTSKTDGRDYNGQAFTLPTGIHTSNGVAFVYTGEGKNATITKNGTPVDAIVDVGTYVITYTYNGDTNYNGAEATITVTIAEATVEFKDITIRVEDEEGNEFVKNEWTYEEIPALPIVSFVEGKGDEFVKETEVYYEYLYSADGQNWPDENNPENWTCWDVASTFSLRASGNRPENAGHYKVRARIDASATNYKTPENVKSPAFEFEIKKAPVEIIITGENPSKGYDGISVSHPTAIVQTVNGPVEVEITVTINGKPWNQVEMKNQGTYKIVYSYNGGDNYLAATPKEVTVTISKVTPTISAPTFGEYSWTYGSEITDARKPSAEFVEGFATDFNGSITFKYYLDEACTQPTSAPTATSQARDYWVKAVFDGTNHPNLNSAESAVATKITIGAADGKLENVTNDAEYLGEDGKVYRPKGYTICDVIANLGKNHTEAATITTVYTKWNKATQKYDIPVDGETITNTGIYQAVITLAASTNYDGDTVTVCIEITQETNNEIITVGNANNFVYGAPILSDSTIKLPAGVEGTWELRVETTTDGAVVGSDAKFEALGDFTFWAVFTPDENQNYKVREEKIPVTVNKALVTTPTIEKITFNGQGQNSGIGSRPGYAEEDYVVYEDILHTAAGSSYRVILKLKNANCFKWTLTGNAYLSDANGNQVNDADAEYVTIPYRIYALDDQYIKATITPSWQYQLGQDSDYGSAQVTHGGYEIYYKPEGADDSEFTTDRPTLPGKYVARFVTTDTNYEIEEETLTFEITAREITPPDLNSLQNSFPYTGDESNPIKSGLEAGKDDVGTVLYTIVGDNGYVNVNAEGYTVYLQLASEYYVWDDGNSETIGTETKNKSFTYHIEPLKIDISVPTILNGGWEYSPTNANAKDPEFDFLNITLADEANVEVTYKYYTENGTYLGDNIPSQAGKYYVEVQAKPKSGYNNLTESDVETSALFEITQVTIPTLSGIETQYEEVYDISSAFDKTAFEEVIRNANTGLGLKFSYYLDGELYTGNIKDAETYDVVITLDEATDKNYNLTTNGTTKIVINPTTVGLANTVLNPVPYNTPVSAVVNQIPKSDYGTWTIEATTLGDVGDNKTFVAVFTPHDVYATNFEENRVNVTINVTPATLSDKAFTVTGATSGTYTSNAFTIPSVKAVNGVTLGHANVGAEVIIKKNGETVGEIRGAGTYTITYNFAATQNYQAGSTTVEFTVAPGQINFVGTPTIAPWSYQGYNATVNKPSITVKLGDVNVATLTGVTIPVVFHYYSDEACTPESKITDSTVEGYQAILNALDVTTYYVKAEVVDDGKTVGGVYNGNYYGNWSDATSFTLTPANVTIQDANNTAFTSKTDGRDYNGQAFTLPTGIHTSNGVAFVYTGEGKNATITKNGTPVDAIVDVGTYVITYTYNGDTNYNGAEATITVTIAPANIKFNGAPTLTLDDKNGNGVWDFNEGTATPDTSFVNREVDGILYYGGVSASEVYYEYQYSATGKNWSDSDRWIRWGASARTGDEQEVGIPTAAGYYRVRARVISNANYNNPADVWSEPFEFEIKKASICITDKNGNAFPETDTRPYNGTEYPVPGYTSSYNVPVKVTVTFNGEVYDEDDNFEIIGAGTYTITYKFVDTTGNYEDAIEAIVVTISPANVTIINLGISGWTYDSYQNNEATAVLSQYAQDTSVAITFKYYRNQACTDEIVIPEDKTIYDVLGELGAGDYYVRAFFAGDTNLNPTETPIAEAFKFVVGQADTTINTGIDTTPRDYNDSAVELPIVTVHGETLTPVIMKWNESTNAYDIPVGKNETITEIKSVGKYQVTYHYDGTGKNYETKTETVVITIQTVDIQITGVTLDGWTYGGYAGQKPTPAGVPNWAVGSVQYQYARWDAENGTWGEWTDWPAYTNGKEFAAGDYKVKAILADGGNNYSGDTLETTEKVFTVSKASASIIGASNGTVTMNYRPEGGYTISELFPSLTGSHAEKDLVYTVNKTTVDVETYKFTDVVKDGSYTLVISLPKSDNYSAATDITVYVVINPIPGDAIEKFEYPATYGDKVKDIINDLPPGWTLQNVTDDTTVGDYGDRNFTVVFDRGDNYKAQDPETITVKVAKSTAATITGVPTGDEDGTSANNPIELDYNKDGYSINDLFTLGKTPDNNNATFSYQVGDNTQTSNTYKFFTDGVKTDNNGVYELKITLTGGTNYEDTYVIVYVRINPIATTDTFVAQTYTAIYNQTLDKVVTNLPKGDGGEWKILTMDRVVVNTATTTVGTVNGDNKFLVVFYPDKNHKAYSGGEITITINVSPADGKLTPDGIDDSSYTGEDAIEYHPDGYDIYDIITNLDKNHEETATITTVYTKWDEEAQKFDIPVNGDTITEIGKYQAVITLAESANYDGDTATVIVEITGASITFGEITNVKDTEGAKIEGDFEYNPNIKEMLYPTVIPSQTVNNGDLYFQYSYLVDANTATWSDWIDWTTTSYPSAINAYRVRAAVKASDTSYRESFSEPQYFNITIATVPGPNYEVDENGFIVEEGTGSLKLTYTGQVQAPTINSSVYYTITWSVHNANGTQVGEGTSAATSQNVLANGGYYQVTLTLQNKNNSQWNGESTDDIVLKYRINKAPPTITVNDSNTTKEKTYDGIAILVPGATISNGQNSSIVIKVNGTIVSAGYELIDKGIYEITYNYAGNDNYNAASEEKITIVINQAEATWDEPAFVGKKYYQNQINLSTRGLTAIGVNGVVLEGEFEYGKTVFVSGINQSYVELTFTPTDPNYAKITRKHYVTFVTVAKIGNIEYGTIEEALRVATSGTVMVLPYDEELGPIIITDKEVTIKPGVTLVLPYGADGSGRNKNLSGKITVDLTGGTPAEEVDANGNRLCYVKVLLDEGVTLINNGTIEIAGQLSGGSGGNAYAGHTAGQHARLVLGANAKIDNYGTIYAAGFIREQSQNNGSEIILNNGSALYQPFVVRDFPGGSIMYALNETKNSDHPITPFSRFELMNVSPLVRIYYGGVVRTWAALQALSTNHVTVGDFVGGNGNYMNSVIVLDSPYSYLTAKYDVDSHVCDLDIYGDAYTNAMKLKIDAFIFKVDVSTGDVLFAISHHYDVALHVSDLVVDGQTKNTATVTMGQKFKLMTGAKFFVDEGVTLDVAELIVYEEFVDGRTDAAAMHYPSKPPAEFTVTGTLICDWFGGTIKADGATIQFTKATTYTAYEWLTQNGESQTSCKILTWQTIGEAAVIIGTANVTAPTSGTQLTLDLDNGEQTPILVFSDTYPTLPEPEREGYVFEGWYVGETPVESDSALVTTDAHIVKAKWTKLLGITLDANLDGVEDGAIYLDNTHTVYPELPVPQKDGYIFLGWFYNGAQVNTGDAFVTQGDHTLTAQWTEQIAIGLDKDEDGNADDYIYLDAGTGLKYTLSDATRLGYTFLYWYYTDAEGTEIQVQSGDELIVTGNHLLTAKWRKHAVITLDPGVFDGEFADSTKYVDLGASGKEGVYPTLPTLQMEGFDFLGWYYVDANNNKTQVSANGALAVTGNHTIKAEWRRQIMIQFDVVGGTLSTGGTTYAVVKDGDFVYPQSLPTPTKDNAEFQGWYYGDTKVEASKSLAINENHTLTALWHYKVIVETDNATVTGVTNGTFVAPNTQITIEVSFSADNSKSITVKDANNNSLVSDTKAGTYTFTVTDSAVTIKASSSSGCVETGSLITLADGTQKRIEDVTYNDMLLVWDFFKGEYAAVPASVIVFHGNDYYDVVTLIFSDGTEVRTIGAHDFFDVAANEFVSIRKENVASFVGHEFIKTDGNGYSTVTLVDYTIVNKYTGSYSILTAYHNNFIVENMLSLTPLLAIDVERFCEYFEVGEGMKYDEEKMQADIEKYGLYTYEDFADYLTYEQYLALNAPYYKVLVEQGYVTFEDLLKAISLYVE